MKNLMALPVGAQGLAVQPVLSHRDHRKKQWPALFQPVPSTVLGLQTDGKDPAYGSCLLQLLLFLLCSCFLMWSHENVFLWLFIKLL